MDQKSDAANVEFVQPGQGQAAQPTTSSQPQQQQIQWMAAPSVIPLGCPPGLEYLSQIDQLLIHQVVEVFEGNLERATN